MTYQDFQSGVDDQGRRLDRVVRRLLPDVPLGEVYALIRKGRIRVNGRKRKGSYRISEGDSVQVDEQATGTHKSGTPSHNKVEADQAANRPERDSDDEHERASRPSYGQRKPERPPQAQHQHEDPNDTGNAQSQELALPDRAYHLDKRIVFENEHLLCFNKPRGVQMHGSRSLDNWVRKYLSRRTSRSLSFRPGPIHRLDRNTTGLVFFGKTTHGSRRMGEHMKAGRPRKIYLTVLDGSLRQPELWQDTLARDKGRKMTVRLPRRSVSHAKGSHGRPVHGGSGRAGSARNSTTRTASLGEATTAVHPILWTENATLALCVIREGKTHQIRAQAAMHGHPLAGDRKYGGSHDRAGYVLHSLAFLMPEGDESLGLQQAYAEPQKDILTRIESRFGPIDGERILESVNEAAEGI